MIRDYSAATRGVDAAVSLGLSSQASSQLSTFERFDELADAVDLGAEQAEFDDLLIRKVPGELGIDFIFVDGVLALFEQIGVMQCRLLACAEPRAAGMIEEIVDHAFGQPFGFGDIGANSRAIAALVRDRNLDAAHFLELVGQDALI
ncbi:MAG: hypothetical protein WBO12_16105 [Xanthobacteraceae bacterium]